MTWEQRFATFRFWLSDHGAAFGVPIALVVIGAIVLTVALMRPAATGPVQRFSGRVISLVPSPDPTDYSWAVVVVELDNGLRLTLSVPATQTCRTGARAVVRRTPIKGTQLYRLETCTSAPTEGR